MRLYLDSAPVIYAVEQAPRFAAAVDARLSDPNLVLVASDLTRLECRVKPLRDGNAELVRDFDEFFDKTVAEVIGLTREVVDRATEIRAAYGFKVPDSLHLAAALFSGAEVFLTNDHRLDRFSDVLIESIAIE